MNRTSTIEGISENFYAMRQEINSHCRSSLLRSRITNSEAVLLSHVEKKGAASIKDIRTALGISSSAATQLTGSLMRKKLLRKAKNQDDARISEVKLTLSAGKLFAEHKKMIAQVLDTFFRTLSDEELSEFKRLQDKIINNI